MKHSFSEYHPIVQFAFFFSVITITMFVLHPMFLGVSFLSGLCYMLYLRRKKGLLLFLRWIIPSMLLVSILNPLFNHAGMTILLYLPDGNPLTLESIVFGLVSGILFTSIMLWCICLRETLSSDRIIYLFGKVSPKVGLLISMILRFVPKIADQFRYIRAAQHCLGRDIDQGSLIRRLRNAVRIVSILIQWILENSVDTADSMKSRGYGLKGRTSFSLFRFSLRDAVLFSTILLLDFFIGAAFWTEQLDFFYFPAVSEPDINVQSAVLTAAYSILCFLPLISDRREDRKWNAIRSRI